MKTIIKSYWLMAFVMAILPTAMVAQVSYTSYLNNGLTWHYQDTIVDGVTYRDYSVDELAKTCIPEYPQLPKQVLKFSVPYNAHNIAVNVTGGQSQNSSVLPFKIIPVLRDRMICDTLPDVLVCDSAAYHTNALYPASAAELVGEGYYMGENHIVTVAVYPMQYNPVSNKLRRNNRVNFTITYDLASDMPGNVLIREDQSLREEAWNGAMAMVMNPTQVESFAPVVEMPFTSDTEFEEYNDSAYVDGGQMHIFDRKPSEYMIVTTRDLAHSFRRLAALKRQKGYSTEIHCIEDILNDPSVQCGDSIPGARFPIKDDAGKLRQYLRNSFKNKKTQFVLLGGNEVPYRIGYNDNMYNKYYTVPTDLYFSNLTTNWNLDNDEVYGEHEQFLSNNILFDYSPQLFVGRLMAFNAQHIENYTNKLLRYEISPSDYVGNCMVLHGASFCFSRDSSQYHYPMIFNFCEILNQTKEGTNYCPTGEYVINRLHSNPVGYVSLQGHGNPAQISVSNWLDTTKHRIATLDVADDEINNGLDKLDNRYSPFIINSLACNTIPFNKIAHDNAQHFYHRYINLGQSFTLGYNYGGPAFLGNTNSGLKRSSSNLETCFAISFTNYSKIGEIEAFSKEINIARYGYNENNSSLVSSENHPMYVNMVHNLMGDPEFNIWTSIPSTYNDISVMRTNNSITVSGVNTENAIVSVCCNSGAVRRKPVVNGSATFPNFPPNSTVMVYQHNHIPYIAPLLIQNSIISNSQYVIAGNAYLGRNVDPNRSTGDVILPSGVTYELEFTGEVVLDAGTEVQHGATLTIVPSDY